MNLIIYKVNWWFDKIIWLYPSPLPVFALYICGTYYFGSPAINGTFLGSKAIFELEAAISPLSSASKKSTLHISDGESS